MTRLRSRRLCLSLAALAISACRHGQEPADPPKPSIVVISIDTLRSDHLPAYGYSGVSTPALDAFRRDAVLFRHAWSHVPLTLPSHASMLSGRLPTEHGVRDNVGYGVEPALEPWLPSLLRSRGYATAGFVSSFVLRGATGIERGFDHFDDEFVRAPGAPIGSIATLGRSGERTADAALAWLQSRESLPAAPRAPSSSSSTSMNRIFRMSLPSRSAPPTAIVPTTARSPRVDRVVGRLLAGLGQLGIYRQAMVVVLSDHGEGLGDHGEDEHGMLLYREALEVPLLVKLPGNELANTTIDGAVQLIDLAPTLAERAGSVLPPDLHGASLFGAATTRAVYSETYYPQIHFGWQPLQSMAVDDQHYIRSSVPELYDLAADPAECHDRLALDRRRANEMKHRLEAMLRPLEAPDSTSADAATRAELAALGYLSGATTVVKGDPSSWPRPQDRIGVLRDISSALREVRHGDVELGVAKLEAVLAENPLILDGWSELGAIEMRRGRFASALRAYERAGSAEALEQLALGRLTLGQWQAARLAAASAVRLDPARGNAWNHLGVALHQTGDVAGAISAWERAVAVDPDLFDALFNVGLKAAQVGKVAVAIAALERFLERAPPARYAGDFPRARQVLEQLRANS